MQKFVNIKNFDNLDNMDKTCKNIQKLFGNAIRSILLPSV